jgi:hypothetical protein
LQTASTYILLLLHPTQQPCPRHIISKQTTKIKLGEKLQLKSLSQPSERRESF